MSKSRLASAWVLVCLVGALAGCAGNDHGPAECTCATLGENDRRQVAYASWSPAETIPAADLGTVNETLGSYRQRMLFPAKFSVAGAGPASAEFHVYWTPPTDVAELFVMCGTEDGAVDVTLISSAEYSSIVGWLESWYMLP